MTSKTLLAKTSKPVKQAIVLDDDSDRDTDTKSRGLDLSSLSSSMKSVLSKAFSSKLGHVDTVLSVHGTLTTNGAAAFVGALTFDPSGSTEWSTFATLFDEFRILNVDYEMCPTNGSSTLGMSFTAFDNDDATAPSTIDEITSYQNSTIEPIYKGCRRSFRRPDISQSAYWVDVANSSQSLGSVKVVFSYSSVSAVVAYYRLRFHVSFRGRR
jgi:hypothetical protein